MDPFSILCTVTSLVATCAKVGKSLNDVQAKYNRAGLTISAIVSECSVIAAALSEVGQIAKNDPDGLSFRLNASNGQLSSSLELSLSSCSLTMAVLEDEIKKLTTTENLRFLSWKTKIKYVWNEEDMKDLLQSIRGQQSALHLLLTALQTESISDVRNIINNNNIVLQKMLERSQSLKRANTSSTLYGHEAKFDFDEKVVSSRAYRRAFQHFLRQSRSDCKLRAVDKEPDLTDTDTASIHPISHRTIAADGGSEVEIVKRSENIQLLKQHNEVNLIELDDTSSLSPDCVIPNPKAITHCKSVGDLSTPPDLALGYSWWDQTAASSVHIAPNFSRFVTCPTLPTPSSVDSGIQSERPTTQPSPRAFDLLVSSSLDRSVERSRIESQPSQSSCQTTIITQRSKTAAGDASHSTGSAIQAYGSRVEHKQLDLLSPRDPYKMLGVAAGFVGSWTPQRETVNSQSQWELNTFLRSAVNNGHVASLETLLRKGADIEASDENGNRALHIAALKGCTEVVETLLRSGADKEAPCETGDRPLHLATHQGHLATVDALLKRGAQIHANGHGMYSPLHYAANGGHIEIVELLLRNGANTLAMNQAGQLPVDLAKIHGHDHVIELLVKRQQHKPDVRSEGHMVASLYQPGFEFASRVNWPQAKQKGLDRRKSLLVNIQDSSILTCQALNRDLWSDLRVQDEIKRRFVFLQYAKNDPNGAQYIQQHFRAYDRQDAYPHIAIVDPRTGKHTSIWGGPPVPSVNEFLSQLYKFRDRYS